MPIIVRILIGAKMHREIDELPQLVLVSQHLDVVLSNVVDVILGPYKPSGVTSVQSVHTEICDICCFDPNRLRLS